MAARQLRLESAAAMFDAIGETGVHLFPTEVEIRLARVAHRPAADAIVEIEQAGLVGDFRARPCGHQAARRRRRNRRLLIARTLTEEAAGTDGDSALMTSAALNPRLTRLTGNVT